MNVHISIVFGYRQELKSINIHSNNADSKDLIASIELLLEIKPKNEEVNILSDSVILDLNNVTEFQKEIIIHQIIGILT
ncbi:unnamed protein product [Rotaria sp. Silwood2]|nr:unnamed protein product [Rotaria sp. Silwood2]CAF2643426.1 unnamed protein product [Rotaria sp. Silwood2]CAF3957775.1 unnamed protein product [Rotaria sp. Silwood2]CAF4390637.1 unnamed protein product [Rotaria sp. Silwood2]